MSSTSSIDTTSPLINLGRIVADEKPTIFTIPSDALSLAIGGFYGNPCTASEVCKSWKERRSGAFHEIVKNYDRQDLRISRIISSMMPKDGSIPQWEKIFMKIRKAIINKAQIHGIDPVPLTGSLSILLDKFELARDDHLIRCFERILQQIPQERHPLLEGTTTAKATIIRTWMVKPESRQILSTITMLDLSFANLYVLPPEIDYLTNLRSLNLQHNQLTLLPESFVRLINLQRLSLSNNQLTSLPVSFHYLNNLQWLDLGYNHLTFLPEPFGLVNNLQELYLAHNQLISLPKTFGRLTSLRRLSLEGNRLPFLPKVCYQLDNLQWLSLDYNQNITFLKQRAFRSVRRVLSSAFLVISNRFNNYPR